MIGVVAGFVNFTGKGNSKQGCKITLKPSSAVLLGVLVRDDYIVSNPFTVPEEDKAALLAEPKYLHIGVWWMQLLYLGKKIDHTPGFEVCREPPEYIVKYQNTINDKDRSEENILYQRRLTKKCLSFSDPDTEMDERTRVHRITKIIDKKTKGLPNSHYLEAVCGIMVFGEWLPANDSKLDV